MPEVEFFTGYSSYDGYYVSDTEICKLVGLDTYKALYTISPDLYLALTDPMTAPRSIIYEVKTIISLHENITPKIIKKNLVIRCVNGPNKETDQIIAGLIHSSEPLKISRSSSITQICWVTWMFIMVVLIIFVFIFYVWPSLRDVRSYVNNKFGSPSDWLERSWL
jgi:hypothetical protein